MDKTFFLQLRFGTPVYDLALDLRDRLLRQPLGLAFTTRQIAEEYQVFHFGLFDHNWKILGVLILQAIDNRTLKMRQVAIDANVQGKGFGRLLVQQAESWALRNGYQQITMHARVAVEAFYLSLNYQKQGDEFTEVGIKHITMTKDLMT